MITEKHGIDTGYSGRVELAKSLFGILSTEMTLEEAKEERLKRMAAYVDRQQGTEE